MRRPTWPDRRSVQFGQRHWVEGDGEWLLDACWGRNKAEKERQVDPVALWVRTDRNARCGGFGEDGGDERRAKDMPATTVEMDLESFSGVECTRVPGADTVRAGGDVVRSARSPTFSGARTSNVTLPSRIGSTPCSMARSQTIWPPLMHQPLGKASYKSRRRRQPPSEEPSSSSGGSALRNTIPGPLASGRPLTCRTLMLARRGIDAIQPSSRAQRILKGPELDGRGIAGARIVLLQQVRGRSRASHRRAPAGGQPGRDAGGHDHQVHLAVAVVAHPVLTDDVTRVRLCDV